MFSRPSFEIKTIFRVSGFSLMRATKNFYLVGNYYIIILLFPLEKFHIKKSASKSYHPFSDQNNF